VLLDLLVRYAQAQTNLLDDVLTDEEKPQQSRTAEARELLTIATVAACFAVAWTLGLGR